MLQKIELQNFKCFKKLNIDVNYLNVFSGINGMGKSTVIQALLMLRQSYKQGFLPKQVCLNGDVVKLGAGKDVLFESAADDYIQIILTEDQENNIYDISYKADSDVLDMKKDANDSKILMGPFEYLNAERMSPQAVYPKSTYYVDSIMQLGVGGQFTVHYLLKHQDDPTAWNSCGTKPVILKEAVQYWLNEISPNVKIDLQNIENAELTKIGYYFSTGKGKSNIFRPTNVGFGISYILPVIVAILKAKKDSVLIIENPEAHLHPMGQRKIGELISMCAASGVQIFIETHSDHVLNGIRIATKKQLIKHDAVNLFFFKKIEENNEFQHIVEMPKLNEMGKLDYWPDGFFDEWEKALDEII